MTKKTAAGPWRKADPPRDGSLIVGYWKGSGWRVARWDEDALFGCWNCGYLDQFNEAGGEITTLIAEIENPIIWAELYWSSDDLNCETPMTFADLGGMAPGLTGDMSSEDAVRSIRDEW